MISDLFSIEAASASLVQWITTFANHSNQLLQADSKTISMQWDQLLEKEQEKFYSQFAKIRDKATEEIWIHFFQTKVGFLFSPLPDVEKPEKLSWWNRFIFVDRTLWFTILALSAITNRAKLFNNRLTPKQLTHLQALIIQQQEKLQNMHDEQWAWLDPLRCHVKSKLAVSITRMRQLLQETQALPIIDEITTSLPISADQKSNDHTEQHSNSLVPKQHQATPTILPIEQKVDTVSPTPLNPPTSEIPQLPSVFRSEFKIRQYHDQLRQVSDFEKQRYCVAFFSGALIHMMQKPEQFSIANNPLIAERCQAMISLFWEIIKTTQLADSVLGVTLSSLTKSFAENSLAVQQHFFVKQAKSVVKQYKDLLPPSDVPALSAI